MSKPSHTDAKAHAWAVLLTAHARLVDRIEAKLAAAELPPLSWYDVLWALESAPEQRLRMSALADRVVLSRPNLTRLADRLATAGLMQRVACADDRRGAYCVLTAPGRALRRKMWPVYRDSIDRFFGAHVSEREAETIAAALARAARAAGDIEEA